MLRGRTELPQEGQHRPVGPLDVHVQREGYCCPCTVGGGVDQAGPDAAAVVRVGDLKTQVNGAGFAQDWPGGYEPDNCAGLGCHPAFRERRQPLPVALPNLGVTPAAVQGLLSARAVERFDQWPVVYPGPADLERFGVLGAQCAPLLREHAEAFASQVQQQVTRVLKAVRSAVRREQTQVALVVLAMSALAADRGQDVEVQGVAAGQARLLKERDLSGGGRRETGWRAGQWAGLP